MKQPGFSEIKRRVRKLLFRYQMIQPGDRVAVGLSGGKDSSFLLHMLHLFQEEFRWDFELFAFRVVDPFSPCYNTHGLDKCKVWCNTLKVPLETISPPAPTEAHQESSVSPCFKCAWRRKELLFKVIHGRDISTLALGHTAFDVAVTAIMNMTHHGNLETMPPVMNFFSGKIKVIRPISCVSEDQVIRHHRRLKLPKPPPACHDYIGAARANAEEHVRKMIQQNPHAMMNIIKAAGRWPSDVLNDEDYNSRS